MNKEDLEIILMAKLFAYEKDRAELESIKAVDGKLTIGEFGEFQYITGKIHAYREIKELLDSV